MTHGALRACAAISIAVLAGVVACARQSERRILAVPHTRGRPQGRRLHHEQLRAAGEWLRDNRPSTDVVALSSIGALAWFADRPPLDMMGLTDRYIGRRRIASMGKGRRHSTRQRRAVR